MQQQVVTGNFVARRARAAAAAVGCVILTCLGLGCDGFPAQGAVEQQLARLRAERSGQLREHVAFRLLSRMREPRTPAEVGRLEHVTEVLTELYLEQPAPWFFEALDQPRMDAALASALCAVYPQVHAVAARAGHVRTGSPGQRWLAQCVGRSLSRAQYEAMVQTADPTLARAD